MVRGLGAEVRAVERPFNPEGGAYGHGAVHGHSHSHGHHAMTITITTIIDRGRARRSRWAEAQSA